MFISKYNTYLCRNKNENDMNNLTKSIEERAINLIIYGVDAIEAVKQAIIEENKLITELLEQRTERSQKAKARLCKNTYHLIHLMS